MFPACGRGQTRFADGPANGVGGAGRTRVRRCQPVAGGADAANASVRNGGAQRLAEASRAPAARPERALELDAAGDAALSQRVDDPARLALERRPSATAPASTCPAASAARRGPGGSARAGGARGFAGSSAAVSGVAMSSSERCSERTPKRSSAMPPSAITPAPMKNPVATSLTLPELIRLPEQQRAGDAADRRCRPRRRTRSRAPASPSGRSR